MAILVVNAGSSSLKYQLLNMNDESVICKGGVERIGMKNSKLEHKVGDKKYSYTFDMIENHTNALKKVFHEFLNADHKVIKDIKEIKAIGHRVLHSGVNFTDSVLITPETLPKIEENTPLGPLHMPANIACIKACMELTNVPMVATFDTAFHMTMPQYAYMYGVKYEDYEKYHIRKYGFHGTSHKFVAGETKRLYPEHASRIVTCHLGNGSSMAAIKDGKCIDTTMGFTPLEGLIMGTRSGNIDPAVVEYLMNVKNIDIHQAITYLNKECGFLGISGFSSDSRDLNSAADKGDERAKLALDMFAYHIKKYIGAYAAAMGGIDSIIFTGGIGENSENARKRVVAGLEYLGVELDQEKNIELNRKEGVISKPNSKVLVAIIPTNEELVIARDTKRLAFNI